MKPHHYIMDILYIQASFSDPFELIQTAAAEALDEPCSLVNLCVPLLQGDSL